MWRMWILAKESHFISLVWFVSFQLTCCSITAHSAPNTTSTEFTLSSTLYLSNATATDSIPEDNCYRNYKPDGPLIYCSYLPKEFITCTEPVDLKGNQTAKDETGVGCVKFGGQTYGEVEFTKVTCTALPGIECYGNRTFWKDNMPCIKYSGHYFVTTLLYSVLLGFLGVDRFSLQHTGIAVGKLLSVGGLGVWWLVDIILLVTGYLVPADGSNWEPYY